MADYDKLLKVFEGLAQELGDSYNEQNLKNQVLDCKCICKNELMRKELIELGYENIDEYSSINANYHFTLLPNIDSYKKIILWLRNYKISCPDSKSMKCEPGKYYVLISFEVGAYNIIKNHAHTSDNYEKAEPLFKEMWEDILAYSPDAVDSHHYAAYFEIHSKEAAKIWNDIDAIVAQYSKAFDKKMNNDKEYQIFLLKEQIKKLENS